MKPVLSKTELQELMQVPTTLRQAKQIVRRNTLALKALKAHKKAETIFVGCPHCIGSCNQCAYPQNVSRYGYSEQCLGYKFGDLNYRAVEDVIELSADALLVFASDLDPETEHKAERWLRGHVEWAENVIKTLKMLKSKRGKGRK